MKKSGKQGRHGPAFVLLQLAKEPSYGLDILNRLKKETPFCLLDTAAVYRSLQQLEEAGAVVSSWDTTDSGPAKKHYELTEKGWSLLNSFKQDMVMRVRNMEYFLTTYEALRKE
ncbi:PadR family transcriptional regulator [Geobacter argillaceus]|uniref:Transcriptional regulator, PadR family n=1 Tax=Geobacter argillaceus TaxID=345631 RepID=A0A562VLP1_9BACT|nr:PadR family transcriptional regulator [Geobacter argillaceus]TWJ18808.1 transcriptional regulator, PadR family [Geobacter argillaceus]